ncbi:VOC family protein [Saccharomonospora sp. NPDC046836]|uniref:VOC family protein n=1 Tax=Saccharomonospora sp. NPDC046836 TaxID=3156921 RepID=UPI0033FCE587
MTEPASTTPSGDFTNESDISVVQVAIVVRDLDATIRSYRKTLGWGPWRVYDFRELDHRDTVFHGQPVDYSMRIGTVSVGGVYFEVIQPTGPGPYQTFIDEQGEGLHHIQVRGDDATATRKRLDEAGLPRLMSGRIVIDSETDLDYVLHDGGDELHLLVETTAGDRQRLLGMPQQIVSGD